MIRVSICVVCGEPVEGETRGVKKFFKGALVAVRVKWRGKVGYAHTPLCSMKAISTAPDSKSRAAGDYEEES